MMIRIQSLFLKIFLWFWATVIVTGIALVVTWILLQPKNAQSELHSNLADTAWVAGTSTVDALEHEGTSAASAYVEQLRQKTHLKSCLFDPSGNVVAGRNCANFAGMDVRAISSDVPVFNANFGFTRVAVKVQGGGGRQYVYVVETAEHRGPPEGIGLWGIALRWSVPFLVSGLICYLLVCYLTAPIFRLREASQRLAQGDLSTRASTGMERRHDELGSLVRDFNAMAARIEELVSRQRQLIYDISHELRSPLARLNVALDLGRERRGNDSAFDHMEQDLACLNDMIEHLLTLARLDTSNAAIPMAQMDLVELVSQIVLSADFELRQRNGNVHLISQTRYFVQGNAELLHSAIENVIRNAIRYTGPGNSVEVQLASSADLASARILVHDHGQGVPESELVNIFEPFYRVADDRNRQAGGTGLGLAIANRVVRIHGGTIKARNMLPHGLEVEILLPQAVPVPQTGQELTS
jgi:two-component system sensor histidine kinase CpxA